MLPRPLLHSALHAHRRGRQALDRFAALELSSPQEVHDAHPDARRRHGRGAPPRLHPGVPRGARGPGHDAALLRLHPPGRGLPLPRGAGGGAAPRAPGAPGARHGLLARAAPEDLRAGPSPREGAGGRAARGPGRVHLRLRQRQDGEGCPGGVCLRPGRRRLRHQAADGGEVRGGAVVMRAPSRPRLGLPGGSAQCRPPVFPRLRVGQHRSVSMRARARLRASVSVR
mmetsp:Transcript_38926/g.112428  ORF Transcript_38926/g.112428 Transcript_38926/m.112428 type:complete len:227 (+) Transcript_38926:112-792(+)